MRLLNIWTGKTLCAYAETNPGILFFKCIFWIVQNIPFLLTMTQRQILNQFPWLLSFKVKLFIVIF